MNAAVNSRLMARGIYSTSARHFARMTIELFQTAPGLRSLEAAQWGAVREVVAIAEPGRLADDLRKYLQHQRDKLARKESRVSRAGLFTTLDQFLDRVLKTADEELREALPAHQAVHGDALDGAQCAGWFKEQAVRECFTNLIRLGRIYEADVLSSAITEDVSTCLTN